MLAPFIDPPLGLAHPLRLLPPSRAEPDLLVDSFAFPTLKVADDLRLRMLSAPGVGFPGGDRTIWAGTVTLEELASQVRVSKVGI